MTDEPVTWHYGLMAEQWAEFNTDAPEAPFFQREIARFGQPALDLGCGVERLLLPLLRARVDIDGCDILGDMLRHCRDEAASQGLEPRLYQQPMHAFDLPRKYRTIYMCDAFDLAGSRDKDLAALRRCFAHLQDGGALLLNMRTPYTEPCTCRTRCCSWCRSPAFVRSPFAATIPTSRPRRTVKSCSLPRSSSPISSFAGERQSL